jgi:hypothetical protein
LPSALDSLGRWLFWLEQRIGLPIWKINLVHLCNEDSHVFIQIDTAASVQPMQFANEALRITRADKFVYDRALTMRYIDQNASTGLTGHGQ